MARGVHGGEQLAVRELEEEELVRFRLLLAASTPDPSTMTSMCSSAPRRSTAVSPIAPNRLETVQQPTNLAGL